MLRVSAAPASVTEAALGLIGGGGRGPDCPAGVLSLVPRNVALEDHDFIHWLIPPDTKLSIITAKISLDAAMKTAGPNTCYSRRSGASLWHPEQRLPGPVPPTFFNGSLSSAWPVSSSRRSHLRRHRCRRRRKKSQRVTCPPAVCGNLEGQSCQGSPVLPCDFEARQVLSGRLTVLLCQREGPYHALCFVLVSIKESMFPLLFVSSRLSF